MSTVLRFKQYLDAKGIANRRAEGECGLSNGLIANAIKAGSSFGSDKLEKILSTYSDLSAEWLLRGTGEMIIGGDNHEQVLKSIGMPTKSKEIVNMWMKYMEVTAGMQDLYKLTINEFTSSHNELLEMIGDSFTSKEQLDKLADILNG